MLALAAALLTGPQYAAARPPGRAGTWAAVPLLLLTSAVLAACLAALLGRSSGTLLLHAVLHAAPLAGAATIACLLVAVPASLARPGWGWLATAWCALLAGPAGWSVVAMPQNMFAAAAALAVLLLPVMVVGLSAAWGALPVAGWQTAAGLGARWPTIVRALLPAAWPAVGRLCLLVFALAAGLLASSDP